MISYLMRFFKLISFLFKLEKIDSKSYKSIGLYAEPFAKSP
jgi:hypothetical protein